MVSFSSSCIFSTEKFHCISKKLHFFLVLLNFQFEYMKVALYVDKSCSFHAASREDSERFLIHEGWNFKQAPKKFIYYQSCPSCMQYTQSTQDLLFSFFFSIFTFFFLFLAPSNWLPLLPFGVMSFGQVKGVWSNKCLAKINPTCGSPSILI